MKNLFDIRYTRVYAIPMNRQQIVIIYFVHLMRDYYNLESYLSMPCCYYNMIFNTQVLYEDFIIMFYYSPLDTVKYLNIIYDKLYENNNENKTEGYILYNIYVYIITGYKYSFSLAEFNDYLYDSIKKMNTITIYYVNI